MYRREIVIEVYNMLSSVLYIHMYGEREPEMLLFMMCFVGVNRC